MTDAHCHVATPGATRRFICPLTTVATERSPRDVFFWGVHPWHLDGPHTLSSVRAALLADPSAGVGEIGLDRLRDRTITDAMRDTFVRQLALAVELHRPVVLHGAKCWGEVVKTIQNVYKTLHLSPSPSSSPSPLLFHGFSRSDGLLPDIVALNGFISVGPSVLNDHAVNYRALVAKIPSDRLLVETDATDETLSESPTVEAIAAEVARIRGVPLDALSATLEANASRFAEALSPKSEEQTTCDS